MLNWLRSEHDILMHGWIGWHRLLRATVEPDNPVPASAEEIEAAIAALLRPGGEP